MADETGSGVPILNIHEGRKNVVPWSDLRGIMADTFSELGEILYSHCGPWAGFSMIHDAAHPDQPPRFTKDGINIIRAIDYYNPMQRIVRDEVAHIGSSTEAAAGDGTTSAMLTACDAMLQLMEDPVITGCLSGSERGDVSDPADFASFHRMYTYHDFVQLYDQFVEEVLSEFNNSVMTYKDVADKAYLSQKDAVYLVAKWQGLASAHGDTELAEAAAETFANMPEESWPSITFRRDEFETDDRVKCEYLDDQFSLHVTPFRNNILNTAAGTEFEQSECDLIVLNSTLKANDPVSNEALRLFKECQLNERPVVMLCPGGMDSMFCQHVEDLIGPEAAIFNTPMDDPNYNEVTGLQCVAGLNQTATEADVIPLRSCSVKYEDRTLYLNNLYENPDNSQLHPEAEKSDSRMSKILTDLSETIEKAEGAEMTPGLKKEIRRLRDLYNRIKYTRLCTVRIGGTRRDNAHALDLVQDTLLAVKNSLTEGFVPPANLTLYKICREADQDLLDGPADLNKDIKRAFAQAFMTGISSVLYSLVSKDTVDGLNDRYDKNRRENLYTVVLPEEVDEFKTLITNRVKYNPEELPAPIQPATVEPEILKRFRDVALKYLYTTRIVAPGCVYRAENPDERERDI